MGADLTATGLGEEGLRSEGGQSRGGFRIPGRPVTGFESGTVFRVCQELLPTGSGVRGRSGLGLGECETPAGQVPGGEAPGAGGPAARAWSAAAGSRSRGRARPVSAARRPAGPGRPGPALTCSTTSTSYEFPLLFWWPRNLEPL